MSVVDGAPVHEIHVALPFRLAGSYDGRLERGGAIEKPPVAKVTLQHASVSVAQSKLEMRQINHESFAELEVPLVET